ncbi:MAG: SMP-30/gluconolactonase/LRE family protein [Aliidongia sp.]
MEIELVAAGLKFPEGPIAMDDGSVLLVEIQRGTLSRVAPDGAISVVAELGGGPNGAAIGPDGAVYVCNNGGFEWHEAGGLTIPGHKPATHAGGLIQRVDLASGAVTTLYTECDGQALKGPNDLVFDRQGGFWFSDLGKSTRDHKEYGALYYAMPDGSRIVRVRDQLLSPNGVGLSPDERVLYAAETLTGRLWAFDVASPGVLAPAAASYMPGRVVATLPGYQLVDSLAVEAGGKICVATIINGGITAFDPGGAIEHFPFPDLIVTNICFGGPDLQTAWITGSGTGKLFRARWPRPGLKLNFNA